MKYVFGTEQDMVAGSDALITRAPGGERGPSPPCSPHTRGLCQTGAIVKLPLYCFFSRILSCHDAHILCLFLAFSCLRWVEGGEEREPQQTWWHLIWVYFTTRLSLVKLFVFLNQTFLLYGHAELKNVFNLTLSAKLDHLGPVFVSMAVLLLSSRVC